MRLISALLSTATLLLVFLQGTASAYPIEDLSVLEKVYLEGMLGNQTVLIIDIDHAGNRVKVQRQDGFSEWVNPSRIMSKWEARIDTIEKGAGIALIAQCVYMEDNCDSNRLGRMLHNNEYRLGDPFPKKGGGFLPPKTQTRSNNPGGVPDFMNPDTFQRSPTIDDLPPPPATTPAPVTVETVLSASTVRLFIQNDCHEEVGVMYALRTSSFERRNSFEMRLKSGERKAVSIGSHNEFDQSVELFFTASSLGFTWNGEQDMVIDGSTRRYRKGVLAEGPNNGRQLGLTCPN